MTGQIGCSHHHRKFIETDQSLAEGAIRLIEVAAQRAPCDKSQLAPATPLHRVIQREAVVILVIGEDFGIAAPQGDGAQRFLGIIGRHMVFEFVAEAARGGGVAGAFVEDALDVLRQRNVREQGLRRAPLPGCGRAAPRSARWRCWRHNWCASARWRRCVWRDTQRLGAVRRFGPARRTRRTIVPAPS